MHNLVRQRNSCRLCNSKDVNLVMPIKPSPIGDAYVTKENRDVEQPLLPLDLYQCKDCGHIQNIDIVDPEVLFRNYIYTTSTSLGLNEHFRQYSNSVKSRFGIAENSLVVEIGSNDGTLLKQFKSNGYRVLGVDPARNIAAHATKEGIATIPEYFNFEVASLIKEQNGQAKIIVANNVYAHTDDLSSVTKGVEFLLDHDGVFIFEVSYILDMIDNLVFDTVYHEHLSYHSIAPLKKFFTAHGLHLFDVEKVSTKGGSIRGYVQKKGGAYSEKKIISEMLEIEEKRNLHKPGIFQEFGKNIDNKKRDLLNYLECARKNGEKIVGYGASTTVATLMYHFDLSDKLLFIIDDNIKKHGMYSPGCHLEVKSSESLYQDPPESVVILAWQYAQHIIKKNINYLNAGGKFIIPLPKLIVIDKESLSLINSG